MICIADVLDHLCRPKARFKNRTGNTFVKFMERLKVLWIARAKDRERRIQKVSNRRSLAQELGIRANSEIYSRFLSRSLLERGDNECLGRPRHHCASGHDRME